MNSMSNIATTKKTLVRAPYVLRGHYNILPGTETIEEDAFMACSSVRAITLPDSIQKICKAAFYGCEKLKVIHIPKNVIKIGDNAFGGCCALESIIVDKENIHYSSSLGILYDIKKQTLLRYPAGKTRHEFSIPNTVKTIKEFAFYGCQYLTSIIVPSTVETIEFHAFSGCKFLRSVIFQETNLIDCDFNYVRIYPWAFIDCKRLHNVAFLHNSCYHIGTRAFSRCKNLHTITFPVSTGIEDRAFEFCRKLQEINFMPGCYYEEDSFWGCTSVERINIFKYWRDYKKDKDDKKEENISLKSIDNITKKLALNVIEDNIIDNSVELWKVETENENYIIPEGITKICLSAFYNDNPIERISVPCSIREIESGAFSFCHNLKFIDVHPDNLHYSSIDGVLHSKDKSTLLCYPKGRTESTYMINKDVTLIDSREFWGNDNLTCFSVDENNPVLMAIDGIVYDKQFTRIVKYPCGKTDATFTIPDKITEISDGAFCGCHLYSIIIPETINTIGEYAFCGCENIQSFILPQNVKTIENSTFCQCYSLQQVILPPYLSRIGKSAFADCKHLKGINLPQGMTSIDSFAFSCCKSIMKIILPEGVTELGGWAFEGCSNLQSITIPAGVNTIKKDTFKDCPNLEEIHLPEGQKERFAQMDGLKELVEKFV